MVQLVVKLAQFFSNSRLYLLKKSALFLYRAFIQCEKGSGGGSCCKPRLRLFSKTETGIINWSVLEIEKVQNGNTKSLSS